MGKRLRSRARPVVQRLLDDVVAALFPAACRACGRNLGGEDVRAISRLGSGKLRRQLPGAWTVPLLLLCAPCAARLRRSPESARHEDILCAFAPTPELFALVHAFKYGGMHELADWLGVHLARAARRALRGRDLALVPVPLHPQRFRERGFNQSLLLARTVGRWLGAPVYEALLVRRRATPALARLPRAARHAHVQGAFARAGPLPAGAPLLVLVDDVVTSGATSAAALAALGAPAPQSVVLCLCHARMGDEATLGTAADLC